jgi:hypothetical protein
MNQRGSYSYINPNVNEYDVDDDYRIRIERVDNNIARLYFVNQNGAPVPPPQNTVVRDLAALVNQNSFNGSFFITWIANYGVLRNGEEIIRFTNQKQQSTSGPATVNQRIIEP